MNWLRGLLGKKGRPEPNPGIPVPDQLPHRVEVIPGELCVDIEHHGDQWTYWTEGLLNYGQAELVFGLKLTAPKVLPQDPLEVFANIHHLAKIGELLQINDHIAGPPGTKFLGRACGGFLLAPAPAPGWRIHAKPRLLLVVILESEYAFFRVGGPQRLLAQLAWQGGSFPYPPYFDPEREPVPLASPQIKSVLEHGDGRFWQASAFRQDDLERVLLRIHRRQHEQMRDFLGELEEGAPILLVTGPDPAADACLVWRPEAEPPVTALQLDGSRARRKLGAFILITLTQENESEANGVREDGFQFDLTGKDYTLIRESLLNGTDLELRIPDSNLTLEWFEDVPIVRSASTKIKMKSVAFYQSEETMQQRLDSDPLPLNRYLAELENQVAQYFEERSGPVRGFLVAVAIQPGQRSKIWVDSAESLPNLSKRLQGVTAPAVYEGPVILGLPFQLPDGPEVELPLVPTQWRVAATSALRSGRKSSDWDELIRLIWPPRSR